MSTSASNGYEAAAKDFIAYRNKSDIGADMVRSWAQTLEPDSAVLDLGCGNGIPITQALVNEGFKPCAIDASPTLVDSFREHFPGLNAACEPVETSDLFGQTFDGIVAWGLMFLFSEHAQYRLIHSISSILNPGGQFLFTSPKQACTWMDVLTGAESRSLGAEKYQQLLSSAGLTLIRNSIDEGQNYYYIASK